METFLERFDSGLKEGRSLNGWSGRRHSQAGAWLWELQRLQSQHLGITIAVSGALSNRLGEGKRKGKRGRGPGQFRPGVWKEEAVSISQKLGPRFNAMPPTPRLRHQGAKEGAGPPRLVRPGVPA